MFSGAACVGAARNPGNLTRQEQRPRLERCAGGVFIGKAQLNSTEKGVAMAEVLAPLAGKILAVLVEPGSKVEEDDELVVIEALKMENTVYAPSGGTVKEIKVKIGDSVEDEDLLLVLE
jgi:acetyl-CoA carboxylase biotin carboxyl carrier protein